MATPLVILTPTLCSFAVLSQAGITNTGANTLITGDIGTSPITGAAITGLTCVPIQVVGTIYTVNAAGPLCRNENPVLLTTAIGELNTAYLYASGLIDTAPPIALQLGGQTLTPGVYSTVPGVALLTSGNLTLSGVGDYVIRVSSGLTTAAPSIIVLTNGAVASRVYFIVGSSATLGVGSTFDGNILADTSIFVGSTVTVNGKLLAGAITGSGEVTLIDDIITSNTCFVAPPTSSPRRRKRTGGFAFAPSFCVRRMCYDEYNRPVPCDGRNRNFVPCPEEMWYPNRNGRIYVKYSENDFQCCYRLKPLDNNYNR